MDPPRELDRVGLCHARLASEDATRHRSDAVGPDNDVAPELASVGGHDADVGRRRVVDDVHDLGLVEHILRAAGGLVEQVVEPVSLGRVDGIAKRGLDAGEIKLLPFDRISMDEDALHGLCLSLYVLVET